MGEGILVRPAAAKRHAAAAGTHSEREREHVAATEHVREREAGELFDEVKRELYRSRRYGRPVSLIGIPADDRATVARVRKELRTLDRVWLEDGQYYILAPEIDGEAARNLVARLSAAMPGIVDEELSRGATFPDTALTSHMLVAAVRTERGAFTAPVHELASRRRTRLWRRQTTLDAPKVGAGA